MPQERKPTLIVTDRDRQNFQAQCEGETRPNYLALYDDYQRSLPEARDDIGQKIGKPDKAQEASDTILLRKIFDHDYPLLEHMAHQLLNGQGYGDLAYPTRVNLIKQRMTADSVWGYTYKIRRDRWSGQNMTRACFINRLDSEVWQDTENTVKTYSTKKVARNAQMSLVTRNTMEHYNVSFARH